MDINHQKNSFEEKVDQLVSQYGLIPTRNTLNFFIKSCFYNSLTGVYTNLSEEDRKTAYFYGFKGSPDEYSKKEEEYYSEFPEPAPSSLINYGFGGIQPKAAANFKDLKISDLSIQILNNRFFEFRLSQNVQRFKKEFSSFVYENLSSKKNQLFGLIEKIEKKNEELQNVQDKVIGIKNIDYPKFQDLVNESQKALQEFIKYQKEYLNSIINFNDRTGVLKYFSSIHDFNGFKKYLQNNFSNWHKDLSYVKKRMQKEEKIYNHTDFAFIGFLSQNNLIKEDMRDFILCKGQLDSLEKSKSKTREKWYNDAFDL